MSFGNPRRFYRVSDPDVPGGRVSYALDTNAAGVLEKINNFASLTVVSKDTNDLRAEYRAGFVQGKLQGQTICSARDNSWDNAYLTDPNHSFPKQHGPTAAELDRAGTILNDNYTFLIQYLRDANIDIIYDEALSMERASVFSAGLPPMKELARFPLSNYVSETRFVWTLRQNPADRNPSLSTGSVGIHQ